MKSVACGFTGRSIAPSRLASLRVFAAALVGCGSHTQLPPAAPSIARPATPEARASACDGGDLQACLDLGVQFEHGRGVAADLARAAVLYRRVCDGRDLRGCNSLGVLTLNGRGVTADPAQAVVLYRRACEGGDLPGCINLGGLLDDGRGVAADHPQAAVLYRRACEGGKLDSCTNLGMLLAHGRGVAVDMAQAAALYRQACDGDSLAACNNLARLLEDGRGVAADPAQAPALYRRACEGGIAIACQNLQRVTGAASSNAPSAPLSTNWSTTIASSTVHGTRFENIRSTCGPLELIGGLAVASRGTARCAHGHSPARAGITLANGAVTEARNVSNNSNGRCLSEALRGMTFGSMTCAIELSVVH